MIVPWAAGGDTDAIFRVLASSMEKQLGKPGVIVNITGASGTVGAREAQKAAPDGYTIFSVHDFIHTTYYTGVAGARQDVGFARIASLKVSHLAVIREIFVQPVNLIRSTLIGLWIGILPAVGGSAANILAYDQAKKGSSYPEKFGTGIPDGIIASESSNNANVGGSLITMMAFGIPGDAVTAVMLGALIIHGIQPGPLFVTTNMAIAYGMFAAYFLAHPLMVLIEGAVVRFALRVINSPLHIMSPIVLVLCVVGSYALNNIIENVWTFFIFGLLGYLMVKTGFPLAPLILGVILGDQIEVNYIRAVMTEADWTLFFTRPWSGVMLALAGLSFAYSLWQRRRAAKRAASASEEAEAEVEF